MQRLTQYKSFDGKLFDNEVTCALHELSIGTKVYVKDVRMFTKLQQGMNNRSPYFVYVIRNANNQCLHVGRSKRIQDRIVQHLNFEFSDLRSNDTFTFILCSNKESASFTAKILIHHLHPTRSAH